MASRKSCTHLTWAEAKGKVNPSGGGSGAAKKNALKKMDHSQALAQKIIAKNGASKQELSKQKALERKARRDEERAAAAAARMAEERERERQGRVVKPFEQARARMSELARQQQQQRVAEGSVGDSDIDLSEMKKIAQCRELQLDEIVALEAIFADTDAFLVSKGSDLDSLRQKVDEWRMDEEREGLLRAVARHPPTACSLQLTIDAGDGGGDGGDEGITATLLLHLTLPPMYPLHGDSPLFEVEYFMVTERAAVCSADKPLESLAYLEEDKLRSTLAHEARQIVPDPCVYELAVTWLSEHLFDFVVMNAHGITS